jgi:hypothetical protein
LSKTKKLIWESAKVLLGDKMKKKLSVNELFDLMIEDVSYIQELTYVKIIKK